MNGLRFKNLEKQQLEMRISTLKNINFFFSKQKRRGKTVTLVGEFFMPKEEITIILKTLKKKLGCGGAFKDDMMEFQGDIKDKVRPLLIDLNFKFKPKH